jgi:hypothetical protein
MRVSMILAGAATLLCTAPAALADHERPPRQRSADDVVLVGAIQGLGAGTAVNGLTIEARQFHYTVVVERDGAELVEHRSTTRACSPSGVIQPGDKIVIRAEPGAAVAAGSSYRCGAPA